MARHLIAADTTIRTAKPKAAPYRLNDGDGLYLLVRPDGARWWRFDYTFQGKRKTLSVGTYPATGLKLARKKADEARALVAEGSDPSEARKAAKTEQRKAQDAEQRLEAGIPLADSFEAVAREWYTKHAANWTPSHGERIIRRLERDVFPWLGARPIADVTAPELLAVLRRIEDRGALETAHRAHQNCGQVFRYAVATGRAERDPSGDLRGSLPPAKVRHHPSLTDSKAVADLMRALDGYSGTFVAKCALRLAPLLFVRPGELRHAEWTEIDLDAAEWRIPAEKMKMRAPHIVPLSTQAVAILRELHALTGAGRYAFPGVRTASRPMSENTVNAALRRMGYDKDDMTGHGFRSMASTTLNEQGWHRDAIERQLAHAERDSVRAAYNYAEHLPERRKMMQHWSDYLAELASGAKVLPFKRA